MPVYNSIFKDEVSSLSCGMPLLKIIDGKIPNIDPSQLKGTNLKDLEFDIIDESIMYYRANVLFKSFPIKSDADKLLIYITVLISKCLEIAHFYQNDINKAKNIIKSLIDEGEWSPNLKSHFLNNLLTVETSQVLELQNYLKTVRKEAISRIIYLLYDSETKTMDLKYWLGYAKKKFLGYEFPIAKSIK